MSLKAIMDRVGHSDHRTTLSIYSHVTEQMDKDMMNKLEQVKLDNALKSERIFCLKFDNLHILPLLCLFSIFNTIKSPLTIVVKGLYYLISII